MRVVVDPGVIVSAALSEGGAPAELLRQWADGLFELVASPLLLAELRAVLARSHIAQRVAPDQARSLVAALAADAMLIDDPPDPEPVVRDPKDDYLVALARSAGADAIVSGDRHLLELDLRPPVLTPRELLAILSS